MSSNNFRRYWDLGYRTLVPVIPPGADLSPHSSLSKRVGTRQDARGKTPGTRGRDGLWHSFDWPNYEADEEDLERWHAMGAGVGVKTGFGLIGIDADTLHEDRATIIRDAVDGQFGRLPVRVGRHPKALYLCRVDGDLAYSRIDFEDERVEILTERKFFVAEGVHPVTGRPYHWPRPLAPFDDLPIVKPADVVDLLEGLRARLPAASKVITEGAGTTVSQAALKGDVAAVRRAVAALPNTSNHFPTRESYRDVGYAIKAALPDDPDEALELFRQWCGRWDGGVNEPDVIEADWRRMKPPFRRGASWLYEIASEHGAFDPAEAWFAPIEEQSSPFDAILPKSEKSTEVYPLLRMSEVVHRPPPAWLVPRHVPEQSLGFLYSAPGVGKSFLALDMALSLAYGLPQWHGDALADKGAVVIYIASEGAFGFGNRLRAWQQAHGVTVDSDRFLMLEETVNFLRAEDVEKLLRTVRALGELRPCLIIVDTVSRAIPGADENLQKEMTLFVAACDRLKKAFACAVLGIHHAGKAGDMRGSTVLLGAGDFVFRLDRKPGATIGNLTCEKQKDGPDGWSEPYRFETVALEGGESSLVPWRADLSVGPSRELTPATSAAVLGAMRAAWEAGEPWAKAAQAKERQAVRRMVADFGFTAPAADELLLTWERSGLIRHEMASQRTKKQGFRVVGEVGQDVREGGVFD